MKIAPESRLLFDRTFGGTLLVGLGLGLGSGSGCFSPDPLGIVTEGSTGPMVGSTSTSPGSTGVDPDSGTSVASISGSSTGPVDPDGSTSSGTPDSSGTTEAPPQCDEGELECAGQCFDPQTDPEHCGDCDTVCSATEVCVAGQCESTCAAGELECAGQCVDPLSDPTYCGAGPDCAVMPGTACAGGETCVGGTCVGPGVCTGFVAGVFDADLTASAPTLEQTRMAIAWDGASLWTSSGGGSGGIRLVEHDPMGVALMDYAPALDLRSVFTQGDGGAPLYARVLGSPIIRVQIAPGSFVNDVTLVGGMLDGQASVAWDSANGRFIAQNNGIIDRWDVTGAWVDSVTLVGHGSMGNESMYPQNRGVAFGQGCYLTIDDGILSAWNTDGDRVDTAVLNQAMAGNFDHNFSVSYARGRAWHGGNPDWLGYDVFGVAP